MGFSLFGKNKQSASDTGSDEMEGKASSRRRKKSAEQPVDPVLPEKKRARRRLVGAAAMVLAAIIGLPMLLESEPQPLAEDIQINIPSLDKSATDSAVAASEQAPAVMPVAGDEASAAQGSTDRTAAASDATSTSTPSVTETPSASAATTEKSKKPAVSASAPAEPKAQAASQPKSSTESERAAQVRALLDGKSASAAKASSEPASAQTKPEKFVLQVAALSSADKAKELQQKLSKAGISSYTEKVKVSGSEQIRVRVGPFASREEADKVRGKLSGMGLNGMVMTL